MVESGIGNGQSGLARLDEFSFAETIGGALQLDGAGKAWWLDPVEPWLADAALVEILAAGGEMGEVVGAHEVEESGPAAVLSEEVSAAGRVAVGCGGDASGDGGEGIGAELGEAVTILAGDGGDGLGV